MPHQVAQSLLLVVGFCIVVVSYRAKLGMRSITELSDVLMHAICGRREFHYLIVRG